MNQQSALARTVVDNHCLHYIICTMKKIAIIGLPGSGKSTFANKLGQILNLPVYHLDKMCFDDNVKIDHALFVDAQQKAVDTTSWIIEGCSIKTLDVRFSKADTVIYLCYPRYLCIWRVLKRALTKPQHLSDSGCANFINYELLEYIWNFKKEKSLRIKELKNQYPNLNFYELYSPKELKRFLTTFQA